MSAPEMSIKRRRITLRVSETFSTLHVEKIEEEREAEEQSPGQAPRWRRINVIWSIPISVAMVWHLIKSVGGGGFL